MAILNLTINGYVQNGTGKFNIMIHDVYDFEWSTYDLSSLKGLILTVGNNLVYADQGIGIIKNYDIYINLDYEYNSLGAFCSY